MVTSRIYWLERLVFALEKSRTAPSERARLAYLDLAHHYWSMHALRTGDRKAPPLADFGRTFAPQMTPGDGRAFELQSLEQAA